MGVVLFVWLVFFIAVVVAIIFGGVGVDFCSAAGAGSYMLLEFHRCFGMPQIWHHRVCTLACVVLWIWLMLWLQCNCNQHGRWLVGVSGAPALMLLTLSLLRKDGVFRES